MIEAQALTKRFDDTVALDALSCQIPQGAVYGLVGSNGAGKSTFLRLLAGAYRPDSGTLTIDQTPIYKEPEVRADIAFVPDDLYFLPQSNLKRMRKLYGHVFRDFSSERFTELAELFRLDQKKRLGTFSKGMRRQAALILALARRPRYLLMDEVFDGLDPIMRNYVRDLIYRDVRERQATAVISSHSLRELEDTCDQLALLHQGHLILESEMNDLQTGLGKLQLGFESDPGTAPESQLRAAGFELVKYALQGKVATVIIRAPQEGLCDKVVAALDLKPVLTEELPLTLEEVFTYEMEALGYCREEVLPDEESEKLPVTGPV
ncbi:MAG: ABC transporter ATP-binding protein [Coriobacteriia bacterium]|nr:ABC transporter ATP-binding protein [Coriobacteriia bacterium]